MARSRPRPRRGKQPTKSRLKPCTYTPDLTLPDPRDADHPLCGQAGCGLPRRHSRHAEGEAAAARAAEAQAEHLRRAGDDT